MTITLKDGNSVWIAVGAGNIMPNAHIDDLICEDNLHLWRVSGVKNCIMASVRAGGIDLDRLRYQNKLGISSSLNQSDLILKTVPKLKELFASCDMMDGNESWQTLLIAKDDKAFAILPSFTCCEIEDFDTRGGGADVTYGAMAYYKDLPPKERIAQSFRILEKARSTKYFPVVMMNTVSRERIVIYE